MAPRDKSQSFVFGMGKRPDVGCEGIHLRIRERRASQGRHARREPLRLGDALDDHFGYALEAALAPKPSSAGKIRPTRRSGPIAAVTAAASSGAHLAMKNAIAELHIRLCPPPFPLPTNLRHPVNGIKPECAQGVRHTRFCAGACHLDCARNIKRSLRRPRADADAGAGSMMRSAEVDLLH